MISSITSHLACCIAWGVFDRCANITTTCSPRFLDNNFFLTRLLLSLGEVNRLWVMHGCQGDWLCRFGRVSSVTGPAGIGRGHMYVACTDLGRFSLSDPVHEKDDGDLAHEAIAGCNQDKVDSRSCSKKKIILGSSFNVGDILQVDL